MEKVKKGREVYKAISLYTLLFVICSITIVAIFYDNDKSFIWGDGLSQHFLNLHFYRGFIINIFKGNGLFNTFTWNLGLGIDLFSNLAYYIVGDFISYLSIFLSSGKMELFYNLACIIRIFLIGISYIVYAKYKKVSNLSCVLGAIIYTFCNFVLSASFHHPYFSNAIFLFPLLLLGIEKIVKEDKKIFYIFIIFITYLSSFYFAYMLSLCILIYGSILIINKYKKEGIRKITKVYLKVFFCTMIGIFMSSVILLPTLNQFLSSNRVVDSPDYLYTYQYYVNLFTSLISYNSSNWVIIGVNSIILFSLPLAIKYYKENKEMLIFLIILFLPLLSVNIGSIFCGFSFPNNRWSFVISFVLAYLTSFILDKHITIDKSDINWILGLNFIYFGITFLLENKIAKETVFAYISLIGFLLIVMNKKKIEKFVIRLHKNIEVNGFKALLLLFIITTTITNIYMFYVANNYVNKSFFRWHESNRIYKTNFYTIKNFSDRISKIKEKDKEFYRISKYPNELPNLSLYYDYNSINYYLSIAPQHLQKLAYDLSNYDYYTNLEIGEFNSRTKILSLLGVKYFITDKEHYIPYGYSKLPNNEVYQNKYVVNFGAFYNKYINIDKYEQLSNLEKESSLLKVVALDEKNIDNDYVKEEKKIDDLLKKDIKRVKAKLSRDGGGGGRITRYKFKKR